MGGSVAISFISLKHFNHLSSDKTCHNGIH